ncbi:MAG: beta-lactamase [Verrucomicrobiaceae bacterium]|nr:beta-lactamase [Verrucomicrobiaceae bacterium]
MIWSRSIALGCLTLLGVLPACRHKKEAPKTRAELNAWPALTPAQAGLDEGKLKIFSDALGGNGVIVRHDSLAYSWGKGDVSVDVASASKPVLVHLVFKAVEAGLIGSIDDPVVKWEPRLGTLNPGLDHKDAKITWRHLMNQTSGYGLEELPGTAFAYNDFQTQLFWELLYEKVYACTPDQAAGKILRPQLFDLLGAQDNPTYRIRPPPQVTGRLIISARDFARMGVAYLHGGKWQGRQIIEEKWVKLAIHSPLPLSLPRTSGKEAEMLPGARSAGGTKNQEDNIGGYGFMWWMNKPDAQGKLLWPDVPEDAYGAAGHGGLKVLIVIPSLDLVVAWNSVNLERQEMCGGGRVQINASLKKMLSALR